MSSKSHLARTLIVAFGIFALLLSLSPKTGFAQESTNGSSDPRGPILPPPAMKPPSAPKANPNAGKSSTDPRVAAKATSRNLVPQAITPQVGFQSSGYRSIHFTRAVSGFAYAFFVTADNDYFYVSDATANTVSMYQIIAGGTTFIRSFGATGVGAGQFNGPEQVAVVGNDIYVSDFSNNRVQRFNKTTGAYVSQFGASGTGAGQFSNPTGMVYNPADGFLYVADRGNNRIQKFNTTGVYQGQFGSFGGGNGQLNAPWGLATDSSGNIYVADSNNNRIVKFASSGTFIRNIAVGVSTPSSVAVDHANQVWVTSSSNDVYAYDWQGNYRIYYYGNLTGAHVGGYFKSLRGIAVTPPLTASPYNGNPVIIITDGDGGTAQLFSTSVQPIAHSVIGTVPGVTGFIGGVAYDSQENMYLTSLSQNKVYKFDKFGGLLTSWGSTGAGNGQFNGAYGITIDDSDNVYVTDSGNNRIQKFSSVGGYLLQWGGTGTANGQFSGPGSLATDGTFIYVSDESNDRIQKFSSTGTWVRKWGTVGTGNGQLDGPAGIAVDRARGQVYVAEYQNSRVQQFSVFGDFIKIFSDSTSGTGALSNPVGLTTDQHGNIYVADRGNNRVVQFNDNGTYLTNFAFTNANAVGFNPTNAQLYVGASSSGTVTRFGATIGKFDTIGVWRPSNQTFYLRNGLTPGAPDITATVNFAQSTDLPIVGDWNGDGYDTPGLYRPSTSFFYLWDSWLNPSMGAPDYLVLLGNPGDQGIAGDWDGDGKDGVGTFRPSNGILYLKNNLTTGVSEYDMVLGNPSDRGIAGDWNLDGAGNAGVFRPSEARFFVTNRNWHGIVFDDGAYYFGFSTDLPVTGDWTHSGYNSIGVFRPSTATFYLKNNLDAAPADTSIAFGGSGDFPIAGVWGVNPAIAIAPPANTQIIKPFTVPPNVIVAPGGGTNPTDNSNAD
jgi:DNA-binding beta-propeller fold protein YncE